MTLRGTSVLRQIVVPLAAGFALSLAAGGTLLWTVSAHLAREAVSREVDAEFSLLEQRTSRLRIVAVIDDIDYRTASGVADGRALAYLLLDVDGTVLAGNVRPPAGGVPVTGRVLQGPLTVNGTAGDYAYRTRLVQDDYRLLIGRSLAGLRQWQAFMLWSLLGVGGAVLLAGLATGVLVGKRLAGRFAGISRMIGAGKVGAPAGPADPFPDEIGRLSASVKDLLATLNRQLEHLSNISAVISHEFRSPLSYIRSGLRRRYAASGQEEPELARALETLDGLLGLCDSLLEIAAQESAFTAPDKAIDLADITRDMAGLFQDVAAEKGVRIETDAQPAVILGDRALVSRLLANLIENAIDVTPAGGQVRCASRRSGGGSILSVADTGPGHPEPDIDRMIELSAGRGPGGEGTDSHGIGLRMVRAIAIRHGADISVTNTSPGLLAEVRFAALGT